jgi:hypothetical protein
LSNLQSIYNNNLATIRYQQNKEYEDLKKEYLQLKSESEEKIFQVKEKEKEKYTK